VRVAVQCERIVPELSGGVEHFVLGLLKGFTSVAAESDQFDVTIARGTRVRWDDRMESTAHLEFSEVFATASLAHSTAWMWRVPALRTLRLALARGALTRPALRWLRLRLEARMIASREPDVVYSPFHLADGNAANSVVTVHDLRELQPRLYDASTAAILVRNIERASAVVTSWPHPYSQLGELGPAITEKLFLVPFPIMNGPEVNHEPSLERSEEELVLYPAATSQHKNHARLIEGLARVLERRKVKLVCTGTRVAPGFECAVRVARSHGIEDAVHFLGHVSGEELERLYRRAAAVVVPSLWEAASGPVFEAFAYKKPVACADIPPIRSQIEFCGGSARFFDPLRPSQIAEAIIDVLDKPEPYVASAGEALKFMQQFSWERTAKDYLSVFDWVRRGSVPEERPILSFEPSLARVEPLLSAVASY
jgi:glycosyltransferase involved in cell wall biosynthesis